MAQSTQWDHSSAVSLPNHTFIGRAVNQYCAHSFARSWQLPFLNQRKGENGRRKYFMIKVHEWMLPTRRGVEPAISWSPVGRASNWATKAGKYGILSWLKKDSFMSFRGRYRTVFVNFIVKTQLSSVSAKRALQFSILKFKVNLNLRNDCKRGPWW